MEEDIKTMIEEVIRGTRWFDSLIGMDNGGYTGEWSNSNGRLALLHEKELVLNAKDTENILAAVNAVRLISDTVFKGIADSLDSAGIASMALLGSQLGDV